MLLILVALVRRTSFYIKVTSHAVLSVGVKAYEVGSLWVVTGRNITDAW